MHRMITMHARPQQMDWRTNIMAIARRFIITNASRAKMTLKQQFLSQCGQRQWIPYILKKYVWVATLCLTDKTVNVQSGPNKSENTQRFVY